MALTLAESAKLSQNMLLAGVVETIIEVSPILQVLPFIGVEGNAFAYNQENALGGAAFYAVNATWTEGTATFTAKTANLAILGGDADVDNFLQRTRSSITDQRAIQTALKAKSLARKFEDTFIYGQTSVDANSFDGLWTLVTAGQTITGDMDLNKLDQTIDLCKPRPQLLLMSKRTRRKLKGLLQASAHYVESGSTEFGRSVMFYDGIPVLPSDFIGDVETAGAQTGGALSSLYAIYLSEADGLVGLQNGPMDVIDLGQLESKDASRVRIRWYVSIALMRDSAAARLKSIAA
jgi:hypothetical protein